ncbi:MAG: ATP-dependent helicase [Lachnospiraceae bacterium]|nr:ATP-dependent helicase [Lachnospiraceae bacterium]
MTQLNREQLRAVTHGDGPMLVLAGPGSGKTAVLVNRIRYLVSHGTDPHGILVLTFSRAAAQEMRSRYYKEAGINDTNAPGSITFGTFHSIFYHILKSQGLYKKAKILTKDKKIEYMKMTAARKGIDKCNDLSFIMRLSELAGYRKTGLKVHEDKAGEDEEEALDLVYEDYNRLVKDEGFIDFDDMISDCLKMLESNEKIRRKWQERYASILVDEFQDIDARQYRVLMLLAGREGSIFCVGDDDQSIYSFRGADPGVMKSFVSDNNSVTQVSLTINYRCPGPVIRHAGMLIGHNTDRFEKKQISITGDTRPCIVHKCFRSPAQEAEYCAEVIGSLVGTGKENDGIPTVGVLYRISRSGDILEEILRHKGIACKRKDQRAGFYEREMVKDILSYLRLSLGVRREDMFRILNRPHRGLTRDCIGTDTDMRAHMLSCYKDDEHKGRINRLFHDIDFIRGMNCYGAVSYILKGIGLLEHYKRDRSRPDTDEDIDELAEDILERAKAFKSIREWLLYIDRYHDAEDDVCPDIPGPCMVEMRTIHSAKGLEYDNVMMIGLQEGIFPLKKCEEGDALAEERRLFYVGMTRCRKKLWLLGIQKDEYGKRESRFIKEAGLCDETIGSEAFDVV